MRKREEESIPGEVLSFTAVSTVAGDGWKLPCGG